MAEGLFNHDVKISKAVRICRRRDDPESVIRFVPIKETMPNISSKRVLNVMRRCSEDRLQAELEKLVLGPKILIDCMTESS